MLTFLALCPGSEHFLQLPSQALWLPRFSQLPAGLSQSGTIPGLPALPVTKKAGMGVPREPGCAPPDGDSPALAEKGPIVAQGPACPRVPSPDPGGHGLSWLLGSSLPTLSPLHLTCISPLDGLRREAPGAGAGGVAFPGRAMEVGQKWQTATIQLEWRELSCHPIYPPPTASRTPQGRVGTWGLSHFGEKVVAEPPSPAQAPAWRPPHQLGFRPKKERKEAAGRPCPAPRTQGWGDREAREGTLVPEDSPAAARGGWGEQEPRNPRSSIVGTGSYA